MALLRSALAKLVPFYGHAAPLGRGIATWRLLPQKSVKLSLFIALITLYSYRKLKAGVRCTPYNCQIATGRSLLLSKGWRARGLLWDLYRVPYSVTSSIRSFDHSLFTRLIFPLAKSHPTLIYSQSKRLNDRAFTWIIPSRRCTRPRTYMKGESLKTGRYRS